MDGINSRNKTKGTYIKHARDSVLTLLQVSTGKTIVFLGSSRRNNMILYELSSFYNFVVDKSADTIKYNGNTLILSSTRDAYVYMGLQVDYVYKHSLLDMDVGRLVARVFLYDYWS